MFLCIVQAEPNTSGPTCQLHVQEITHAGRISSTNQSGKFPGGISGKKMSYKKVAKRGYMAAKRCCIESSAFFRCSLADFLKEYCGQNMRAGRPDHENVHCSSFSMQYGGQIMKVYTAVAFPCKMAARS